MNPSVLRSDHTIGQINSKCLMSSGVTWTISNFSELCKKNIDCCSPIFSTKYLSEEESQWQLRFFEQCYVSADTKLSIKSLSLYLTLTNDAKPTKVNYTIGIIDRNNTLVNKQNNAGEDVSFSSETPTWGATNFIEKAVLINRIMKYLSADNAIKIYCEIRVKHRPDTSNGAKRFKSAQNPIFKSLTKLINDKKYSDVHLIVGNEKLFAHKNILAACSTYFAAHFERTSGTGVIVIEEKEIDFTVMREMLNFIYSGNINYTDQWNIRLLVAAHKYAIKELKELCHNSIRETLEMSIKTNKTNIYQSVKDLLDTARTFDINELKNLCEDSLEKYLLSNNISSASLIEKCKNILVEAHKYQLRRLKLLCEKNICTSLNISNAIDYLSLAYFYECSELKKQSIDFIVQNGSIIVNQPRFETIANLDKNLLVGLFRALLTFPKMVLNSTK